MHEGVMILSETSSEFVPQRIAFCNQPASKLIHKISKQVGQVKNLTAKVLRHDCFEFIELE